MKKWFKETLKKTGVFLGVVLALQVGLFLIVIAMKFIWLGGEWAIRFMDYIGI